MHVLQEGAGRNHAIAKMPWPFASDPELSKVLETNAAVALLAARMMRVVCSKQGGYWKTRLDLGCLMPMAVFASVFGQLLLGAAASSMYLESMCRGQICETPQHPMLDYDPDEKWLVQQFSENACFNCAPCIAT